MGENLAKDLLDRIFKTYTASDVRAARLDVIQARERGELSDAEESELLATADDRLTEIKNGKRPDPESIGGK